MLSWIPVTCLKAHTPLWHLAGAAHVESLDDSTEAIGCHGDDILYVCIHLRLYHDLRVQRGRQRGLGLPSLFEKQSGDLTAGGRRRRWRVPPGPLQLCGEEHQPFIKGMPQQLQRLQMWTKYRSHAGARRKHRETLRALGRDNNDFEPRCHIASFVPPSRKRSIV